MWMQSSRRLQQLEAGVFQELALAKRKRVEANQSVIDLSVGSPDLPPPQAVVSALQEAVTDVGSYGYAITSLKSFDEAVTYYYRRYGVALDADTDVLQLMGSQDGLAHLSLALLNPGDKVLLPDPGYPIYEASVRLAGGEICSLPIDPATLHPAFDLVSPTVLDETKMMILNYPSNPTGGVATRGMFERALEVAHRHDIFIVHDFAYSEMLFDQHEPVSILSIDGAKDVAVEFNSLSKTFNMAGCRIGYLVGNSNVIEHLRKLKSNIDYGVFLPIQHAAITALTMDWTGLTTQRSTYMRRRDAFCNALHAVGWDVRVPAATMFVWTRTPNDRPSFPFALELLQATGVALTPGAAFGRRGEGYVRMAIVSDEETLCEAARKIGSFFLGGT